MALLCLLCLSLQLLRGASANGGYEEEEELATRVARIGPGPHAAVILFTHLRRCGGTFLEEVVLKPFAKPALVCKEGGLARHHRMDSENQQSMSQALSKTALVWRHCPFGLHQLLPENRAYVYLTVMREPAARMASWFAYCDRYSPDKCKTGKFAGNSRLAAFYRRRREKLSQLERSGEFREMTTFHPDWLEFALDDNYATRMICGGDAHDAPPPIGEDSLACAVDNLRTHYAFVGTLERRDESLCVLFRVLGIPKFAQEAARASAHSPHRKQLQRRGPTTDTSSHNLPEDFQSEFASYIRLDDQLYATATRTLERHLSIFPDCSHS